MKKRVCVTLSFLIIASFLVSACGPSSATQPVVLNLTEESKADWKQLVEDWADDQGIEMNEMVVILFSTSGNVAVPGELVPYNPAVLGVIRMAGMSYIFARIVESQTKIDEILIIAPQVAIGTLNQWLAVHQTADEIQAVAAAAGIFQKHIEWTDPSDGSKHSLDIVSSFAPWSCKITHTTSKTWSDGDNTQTTIVEEVFEDQGRFCIPDMIMATMVRTAQKIAAIQAVTSSGREQLDSWKSGITWIITTGWKLFFYKNGLPLDPDKWTPK